MAAPLLQRSKDGRKGLPRVASNRNCAYLGGASEVIRVGVHQIVRFCVGSDSVHGMRRASRIRRDRVHHAAQASYSVSA
ncbi:hypothetical protein BAUCODRAFT_407619 [Baudoinia panamericana UAMH 10762]|uniref:Uncharacterized protein n=1 Tax=Baudoinia panamericana (strain UAMH 10762) TaxID=717646 RepID=M2NFZ6_BAUPA|nr:uncharacterized protein BAUCODRAFT_407619 [Baudoinia panamericana UAMH 10762]EMC97915.1 hypothetical protein BAUCODRAFT_407619 [Baudoinia panamericana UAMH 10762]